MGSEGPLKREASACIRGHEEAGLVIRLLGPLAVEVDGRPVRLGSVKQKAILAQLALHGGRIAQLAELVAGLWGEDPPATATNTIQVHVSALRRALGHAGSLIQNRPPGYRLEGADVDVLRFDPARDSLLARYASRYLEEEVYPEITKRLAFAPPGKSLVEIFSPAKGASGHQWFSTRMVGLPFIGTVGACAGKMVAIVGRSGAGKTTLVNLLPRFYDVSTGAILIDGVDLRHVTLASLRRQIGIVTQETVLFDDTIAHNIAYGTYGSHGTPGVSKDAIVAAAQAANAHGFIGALPHGYETMIGERGQRLSGGQRQRLAIARALLKNAPVLILDEATSALDSESERAVQAALDVLMRGRTTVVIAHRLSTIERADRIAVLDRGRVVEIGRHDELLAAEGVYARLYRTQYAAERAAA
jgi:ABC-type multidrug transport system ATPase subunit